MVRLINSQDSTLSAEQKAAIEDGANWVCDWYQQRKASGNFTELPEAPEFEEVMSRAQNVQVMVADDMYASLEQALERGELHFRDEILLMCGSQEMALEALKKANQSKRESAIANGQVLGGINVSRYVEEPVIVLNQKVMESLGPEEIKSVMVHETTHAAGATTSEQMLAMIHGDLGSSFDAYADSPREMYARLMQLRQHFGLAPDKECSEEDVSRMREACEKRHNDFIKENGEDKEVPEYIDFMMFDRYSEQEIQLLLNYTADNALPGQERMEIDRTLLAGDLRRDVALSQAKERAFDRATAAISSPERPMQANKDNEHPTVEVDARFLLRLNDRQYS